MLSEVQIFILSVTNEDNVSFFIEESLVVFLHYNIVERLNSPDFLSFIYTS